MLCSWVGLLKRIRTLFCPSHVILKHRDKAICREKQSLPAVFFSALCCFLLKQQVFRNITIIKLPPCNNLLSFTCTLSHRKNVFWSMVCTPWPSHRALLQMVYYRQHHQFPCPSIFPVLGYSWTKEAIMMK